MVPVTLSTTIARPPQEVYDYLADVANHPEFTDHFRTDFHLTREDTYGTGAGLRYKVRQRGNNFAYADEYVSEATAPLRIVLVGRGGRFNRVRSLTTWTLEPAGNGTKVTVETETEPALPTDHLNEALRRTRSFTRRGYGKALKRLRGILEGDAEVRRGARATVSGGARKPASGFRL